MIAELEWHDRAACKSSPRSWWFPDDSAPIDDQVAMCEKRCEVRRECGAHASATNERWAIRAGFPCSTARGRAALQSWLDTGIDERLRCQDCGAALPGRRVTLCPPCRGYVPAGPALEHIAELRKYLTLDRVAARIGITKGSLRNLLYDNGGTQRIYMPAKRAKAILSVAIPESVDA